MRPQSFFTGLILLISFLLLYPSTLHAQINIDKPLRLKLAEAKHMRDMHQNSAILNNGTNSHALTDDSYVGVVPILHVRFYLMGELDIDTAMARSIHSAVDVLNREFENQITFNLAGITHEKNHTSLNDLYASFFNNSDSIVAGLVEPVELSGTINIFICNNVKMSEDEPTLMGFTPILLNQKQVYKELSPKYDRIFIAYTSLKNETTLIHEMGHFLGLSHPWELSKTNLTLLGLQTNSKIDQNHMAYGNGVSEFTEEQFIIMRDYAFRFRKYLLE